MRPGAWQILAVASLMASALATSLAAAVAAGAELSPRHRTWLAEVALLITPAERQAFLRIGRDYRRDAFIEAFWRARDPYPETARNELRDRWESGVSEARQRFGSLDDDRSKILLLHGPPGGTLTVRCTTTRAPVEVWQYEGSPRVDFPFLVVFVEPGEGEPFRIYRPGSSLVLDDVLRRARSCLDGARLSPVLAWMEREATDYATELQAVLSRPEPESQEWLATFATFSTDLPDDALPITGRVALGFLGRHQSRTVVQGVVILAAAELTPSSFAGYDSYQLALSGEVLAEGSLFEHFRYRYGLPLQDPPLQRLPVTFQRYLRPGRYTLVLRVEDLNGHAYFRHQEDVVVPSLDNEVEVPLSHDPETRRLLEEANDALRRGETSLRIVPPPGPPLTGLVRFDTLTVGDRVSRVVFELDDSTRLTKNHPPFNVELDLGPTPRVHRLSATALDPQGQVVATDAVLVNGGTHRLSVRIVEPIPGQRFERSLRLRAEVDTPEGGSVQRLEIFLGEELVATLFQPPWAQALLLRTPGASTFVRAVAYLSDGSSAEDVVILNGPEAQGEVDVELVELYATVTDREGRFVNGLASSDFEVEEDGVPQQIVRFERVEELPVQSVILLDNSASMAPVLDAARHAALEYLKTSLRPQDRAAIVTFNRFPYLSVKLTHDLRRLGRGLAGITPEGGTALYDSLMFALYYLTGLRGQRAVLLLSDGRDEASRYPFGEALEYARRAGVTVYAVGLGLASGARHRLERLAAETGGRAFWLREIGDLPEIYSQIRRELRSQYLLAYQSSSSRTDDGFREVRVKVRHGDPVVRTMSGYYP